MVKRSRDVEGSPTRRALLNDEYKPFDHAFTAMGLFVFGSMMTVLGTVMTTLAFAYEKREGFTSVAEGFGLRTDIAGPIVLSVGVILIFCGLILVSSCGVCADPDEEWPIKSTPSETANFNSGHPAPSGRKY